METCDDEFVAAAKDFIKRQHDGRQAVLRAGSTPPTCTCARTPSRRASARPGRWQSPYHDTMIDHDKNVGADARPARRARHRRRHDRHVHHRQRPAHEHLAGRRHDAVPQREEHQLGGRLPRPADGALAGQDPGRRRSPTRSSSTTTGCRRSWPWPASRTSSRSCKKGHKAGGKTFKVHIDGYNLLPYLTGEEEKSPRKGFIYFNDDGDVRRAALRQLEGRVHGAARARARCRSGPSRSSPLRVPKLFNLRTDPFERADITSNTYYDWFLDQRLHGPGGAGDRRRSSWRRSRSSRRARRRPASPSTRRWRRWQDARERGTLS